MRPAPLRTDRSNAFAHYSMSVRVPKILDEVIARNPDLPPAVAAGGRAAARRDRAATRELPPLRFPAPDAGEWEAAVAAYAGADLAGDRLVLRRVLRLPLPDDRRALLGDRARSVRRRQARGAGGRGALARPRRRRWRRVPTTSRCTWPSCCCARCGATASTSATRSASRSARPGTATICCATIARARSRRCCGPTVTFTSSPTTPAASCRPIWRWPTR